MRVPLALDLHEALIVAGGGDGHVGEIERGEKRVRRVRLSGVLDTDAPRSAVRPSSERVDVAGHRDEGAGHAARRQPLHRRVGAVALADSAEVDAHPLDREADRAMGRAFARRRAMARRRVQLDAVCAKQRFEARELFRSRQPVRLCTRAPVIQQRRDGDIERAVRAAMPFHARAHGRKQVLGNGDRLMRGGGIHPRKLRVRPMRAEDLLEFRDSVKGRREVRSARRLVP